MKRYLVLFTIIINFALSQSTVIFKNEIVWGEDMIQSISGKVEIIDDNETITIKKPLIKKRTFNFSEIHSIKNNNDKIIWSFEKFEKEGSGHLKSSDLTFKDLDERNTIAFENMSKDLNTIKKFHCYSFFVSILMILATSAASS